MSSISTPAPGPGSPASGGGVAANTQQQFVEEPAEYIFNASLTNQVQTPFVPVNIDRDSDFLLTGINGSSTGAFTMNFQLPSQRSFANAPVNNGNILGTASIPAAIGPPPVYRAGSIGPAVQLQDTSGASGGSPNVIQIVFSGIRRLRTK
jgi:hypothetical protein